MELWIGASGYSYPDWVGGFYPDGTRPNRMLAYYARCFPIVELNFTFYRPPTPEMLGKIAAQTPAGFQFLVKLPQSISHEHSPRDLDGFRRAVLELQRLGRLSGLLCQLPQSAHEDRPLRTWVETVGRALGDLSLAVEFRHRSWAGAETAAWMADLGLALVAVDVPDLSGLYPRGWVQSGPTAYVRMHSRDKAKWYRGEKQRYDYLYDDAALTEWLDAAAAAAGQGAAERALFLFNNCHRSQAAINAQRLQNLASGRSEFAVQPPPAESGTAQRSLFDDAPPE
ncbi:MAG TPA: DUF72 domain-containing protein [Gemmataceae bacterium]|nr:DUF72 domain-containing protein [Gemmataceae bacterium]